MVRAHIIQSGSIVLPMVVALVINKFETVAPTIISNKFKFIIIHVPKTGGSTIAFYFLDLEKSKVTNVQVL